MTNKIDKKLITEAVQKAEQLTEAEIKVIIEKRAGNILTRFNFLLSRKKISKRRARQMFNRFGLSKSKNRNAVLLYFALQEKRFEILADEGAHDILGQKLLDNIATEITSSFAKSGINDGVIVKSIDIIAKKMARVYPSTGNTENNISDEPVIQ